MIDEPYSMTRRRALAMLAAIPVALTAGCSVLGSDRTPRDLRLLIPNSPGGGYDLTARTAARILEQLGFTRPIDKFNVIGDGGSVALARLMREAGNDDLIAMVGVGVVGAGLVNGSPWGLSDATALARVVDEPEALVVAADAPFPSIDALIARWQADPRSLRIGAGSSIGGPDHVFTLETARAAGIDPADVTIVPYEGAGALLTALLDRSVDLGVSGAGEYVDQIDAGSLRMLATSTANATRDNDIPTLTESGIAVEYTNWRGFVAPPDIPAETRDSLIDALQQMHDSDEWSQAIEQHGWIDSFSTGDEFARFLADEDQRVSVALADLGVATR
jgi:putative tricarboxylic transport membrane protein